MKEHGMIFNAEMVRAVMEGRKVQTRRIIKEQRIGDSWSVRPTDASKYERHTHDWWLPNATLPYSPLICPFGAVGDRLWVRETHSIRVKPSEYTPGVAWYRESDTGRQWEGLIRWRPSIHMPRWASRITLEITGVRVERLHDISRADAIAEGGPPSHPSIDAVSRDYGFPDFSRSWFGQTWWSIYGEESWQANPWVWVIEFRKLEAGS